MTSRRRVFAGMIWMLCCLVLTAGSGQAHATLGSTDPPIDGLLVSSPSTITMTFTEDVATTPAPEVRVLDTDGNSASDSPLPFTVDPDRPRVLTVDLPPLDRGTWTVSWTVTSATDGHTLSGTWAFRIGGGLPPGQATDADVSPAPWAVALRWLTFLGVAGTAGLLLFPFLTGRRESTDRDPDETVLPDTLYRMLCLRLAWLFAVVALLASLLEPVGAWLSDRTVTLSDHVSGLPDDWSWRPLTLIPLVIWLSVCLVLKRWPGRIGAVTGSLVAMSSLLGLILTSHAAGREDGRLLALTSNALHQWSVALWSGGMIAFVVWAAFSLRHKEQAPAVRPGLLSGIAVGLFVVALGNGLVNTGFMLPIVQSIRDDGFRLDAFSDLWNSRYGIVLLIKVLLLTVPFALAVYHRQTIARLTREAGVWVSALPSAMRRTLRWETAAVALVMLGGSTLAMSAPPARETPGISQITLVSPTSPTPTDDSFLVHLTVDPAQTGDNQLAVRLTGWDGQPVGADPEPRVTLALSSLNHGTHQGGIAMTPDANDPQRYVTSGLNLSLDGWWNVEATVQRPGQQNASAIFTLLLPDPNTQGFSKPPSPPSDPAAEALFNAALERMTSWKSVRWLEQIGSGMDVLVIGSFAVTEPGGDKPNTYSLDLTFSGSFADNASGTPSAAPSFDSRSSITIGDQGWLRTTNGDWLEESPIRFIPPSGWNATYEGATSFQSVGTQTFDGNTYEVITFHLPEMPSSAEAWLVWWIDPATNDVARIAMVSRMHYMTWLYTDIDQPIEITRPVD